MPALLNDVAETVHSDLRAAVYDAACPDDRVRIEAGKVLDLRVGSQLAPLADHAVGTDADPIAESGACPHDRVVSNAYALAQLHSLSQHRCGRDLALSLALWIEERQRLGQGGVSVVDPQQGGGWRDVLELSQVATDYDGCSEGRAKIREVFSPSKKADLPLARRLEWRGPKELASRISGQFGAEVLGKLTHRYAR
jgi:hypothetical protein